MAKEKKENQPAVAATTEPKKKYKAKALQSPASFLECEINDKKTMLAHGEIIELTKEQKNRLSASCTWDFEEVK